MSTKNINTENKETKKSLEINDIISTMLELKELILKENTYLKEMRINDVKDIHDNKLTLIRKLELQQQIIKKNPSLLGVCNAEEKNFLQSLKAELNILTKENFNETLKAKEVNQRLAFEISKAIHKQTTTVDCYNGMGIAGSNSNSMTSSAYGANGKTGHNVNNNNIAHGKTMQSHYAMTINTCV